MVHQPQTRESRRQDVITAWSGEDPELTNFAPQSVNWVIADAFAAEWHEYDHLVLAVQLSGWIHTAGGPVDEGDLLDLNVDPEPVDLDLLNSFLQDEDLDALAALHGLERDPGSKSQGEVVFGTTTSEVTIEAGTIVATELGVGEERRLRFYTTKPVSPNPGDATVTAPIEAEEVGIEYNVGAGKISQLPTNPSRVEGVINPEPTSGGTAPESNDELRHRVMSAPTSTSGGGTADGIEGAVVAGIEGVTQNDVVVIEYHDPNNSPDPNRFGGAPYGEVVVDGGIDAEVQEVIDAAKPSAIGHPLVRPTALQTDVTATAVAKYDAADIDTDRIGDAVARYLSDLGIGDDLYEAALFETMMDADEDAATISNLSVTVDGVAVSGDYTVSDKEVIRTSSVSISASEL